MKGSSFLACRYAQHAVMLLPDPRHAVRGRLSSPTSRSTCQAPPHVLMLRTQAVGMKSCRPRSGLLTWHPSASTADSLLVLTLFSGRTRVSKDLKLAPLYVKLIVLSSNYQWLCSKISQILHLFWNHLSQNYSSKNWCCKSACLYQYYLWHSI